MLRLTALVPLALLPAACTAADDQPGPGSATVSEAKAVGDAAAMLEERKPPQESTAVNPETKP